jgi:murein DD-endopeptidase MepM/ murein hydrolase activator NlpD
LGIVARENSAAGQATEREENMKLRTLFLGVGVLGVSLLAQRETQAEPGAGAATKKTEPVLQKKLPNPDQTPGAQKSTPPLVKKQPNPEQPPGAQKASAPAQPVTKKEPNPLQAPGAQKSATPTQPAEVKQESSKSGAAASKSPSPQPVGSQKLAPAAQQAKTDASGAAPPTLSAIPNPVLARSAAKVLVPKAETTPKGVLKLKPQVGQALELNQLKLSKGASVALANWDSTLQGVSRPFKGTPIPKPPGYGHYCSIVYPGGTWAFGAQAGNSDPCGSLRKDFPGGTIARAGLWSEAGGNNVLLRCDGLVYVYRAQGAAPIDLAYADAAGQKNCVFTVAPTVLPIFGLPYGKTVNIQQDPSSDVTIARGYDYNVYDVPMSVADFGQTPAAYNPSAIWVDRMGRQRDYNYTNPNTQQTTRINGEAAYDWPMTGGKPIVSVADGEVIAARWRDVSDYNCGPDAQGEIYVYHQVGTGVYAERFITYYAHESALNVTAGALVTKGTVLGKAGNTGCSGGNHLHFGVLRTTNLSGARSYAFELTPDGYGVNGIQGIIDPFGWQAPANVDPYAWMMLGSVDPKNAVKEPGAFSIKLWQGAHPPSSWGNPPN